MRNAENPKTGWKGAVETAMLVDGPLYNLNGLQE